MTDKRMRISRTLARQGGGGDDPDAPPETPKRRRDILQKILIPVPTAKTDTAMGLVLIGREVAERYRP